MDIYDDAQLNTIIMQEIIYPIQKEIAIKIQEAVKKYILKNAKKKDNETLSTRTIRNYTTYEIEKRGNESIATIFIDDEAMQGEQQEHAYGNFNKFMSLDMKTEKFGHSISYWLVSWLEETGANGGIGNNPIKKIGMFQNVYKEIESKIPTWVEEIAKRRGVEIVRR